ncbi:hypothetical protein DRW07_14915 [Alteromonas sediminis]|uniref:Uncharacterized protein n=1 Tax=Alteromonas sediminis TaxID=2259342 RepID=A0A3N5XY56_9ALTE|nr:hypothetical protein [Alteromonas sediminis]RPJ66087.1 hypothetical protein DRW07_14915 [Alteromonas sediminis]
MFPILWRIAGVCCICYWAYAVLYGGADTDFIRSSGREAETLALLGIEFTVQQLKTTLLIGLLPLGLLLWSLGDYRPGITRD